MLEKLRIKITIIASLIVTLYAYFYNDNFLKTCYTIIITIILFYFLGGFIEIFLKNQIEKIKKETLDSENTDEDNETIDDEIENIDEDNENIELQTYMDIDNKANNI